MTRVINAVAFAAAAWPAMAMADAPAELAEALRLRDVVEVMSQEGIAQGRALDTDLLGGQGGRGWERRVARIYDAPDLADRVIADFASEMDPAAAEEVLNFFEGGTGREIVALEIEARRAMLDAEGEEAAHRLAAELPTARQDRIVTFVEELDLLERNVAGAMNANLAFYAGLDQGGAFGGEMNEAGIIDEVWAQAPDLRRETGDWLSAYLALAYAPLSDAEFDAYLNLNRSAAGHEMNAALFTVFDAMFEDVSREIGRVAATFMGGSEL